MKPYVKLWILSVGMVMLIACGHDDDEEEGGGSGAVTGVGSSSNAEWVVEHLSEGVLDRNVLEAISSNVNYTDHAISGSRGGTASVSGLEYYSGQVSCGADCVQSTYEATITVVFNNYRVMSSSNVEATVSGTVQYYEYYWSRQSGLSYTSSRDAEISGSSVQFSFIPTDIANWGYRDTISFSASGNTPGNLSGTVTTGGGATYTF